MSRTGLEYPFSYANYFIPEFISRMRRHKDVIEKPSPRQSINLGKILLPMYMRNGCLQLEDLLKAAVITSLVDSQKTAEKIALEILTNVEEYEEMGGGEENWEADELLGLIAKKSQEIFITPHGHGLEQSYHNTGRSMDAEQFLKHENKPDIGVGPGENQIVKVAAKMMRDEDNERKRKLLARLLKEKLLKLGREFERRDDWSRVATIRPYQPGEDTDTIDEDRSIENIIDTGRKLDEIRHDDFLMIKKKKRNRNILFIQDISNTMFYDYEGINSINYSILSLVPLMWGLRKEKWGLILYESNSHIIKDLTDEKDLEPILEDMMGMLTATTTQMEYKFRGSIDGITWGGTVPGKSLEWAYDELMNAGNRNDRLCFIFSDFVISEPGKESDDGKKNFQVIQRMIDDGIRVFAGISPLARKDIFRPYSVNAIDKLQKMGVKISETYWPTTFLEAAHQFIEEV